MAYFVLVECPKQFPPRNIAVFGNATDLRTYMDSEYPMKQMTKMRVELWESFLCPVSSSKMLSQENVYCVSDVPWKLFEKAEKDFESSAY